MKLDKVDRNILDVLQFRFPLTVRPYRSIGNLVGLTERAVIDRIARLKTGGVVRQISPIYDSARIGYHSALAAFRVPPSRIDAVAGALNDNPGVSHNYLRKGAINLWFTLTVPAKIDIKGEIRRLAAESGIKDWYYLPALRTFKIGFRLDMGGRKGDANKGPASARPRKVRAKSLRPGRAFVRELQRDLPLVTRPFAAAARKLNLTECQIAATLKRQIDTGAIRRIASVLRPVKAGFGANVMVAWAPRKQDLEKLGACAAAHKEISHCYQRPGSRKWPFSIYTMVHGKSQRECRGVVKSIVKATGVTRYRELTTVREYKKIRVVYFPE